MPAWIATVVYAIGILLLFRLDRDPKCRPSKAVWIPVVWMLIGGSRPVSQWLQTSPPGSGDLYQEGNPLDRSVVALLLALGIIVILWRASKIRKLLPTIRPIVLFFLYCGLSTLWSDYPDVAFRRWLKALGDPVMVLIVLTDQDPPAAVRRFLARVGFLLLPVSVLLIKYYPGLGRTYDPWDGMQRYIGVATDKNMLGMICLVFGLGAFWRVLEGLRSGSESRHNGPLIANGIVVGIALWLIARGNSMTSLVCFLAASALITATGFAVMVRRRVVVNVLAAALVLVPISSLFLISPEGFLVVMGRDPTLTGRTDIWAQLLKIPINPLVGTGFESFWLGDRLQTMWGYMHGLNEAHNGYLEVYLNLGWVGVALLAIMIVSGYRQILAGFCWYPEGGKLWLAYFVTGIIYSLTEAGFRTFNPVWISFLLAIIASGVTSRSVPGTKKGLPGGRIRGRGFFIKECMIHCVNVVPTVPTSGGWK